MSAGVALQTERLVLRRPCLSDVDDIFAVNSDPLAVAHNPDDTLASREEAAALFERWDEHWRVNGFGYWVIESPSTVGFCGIKFMTLRDQKILNLFYRLYPSKWGCGYASEAASAVVSWALTHQPAHPVIARVRPKNLSSQQVALKAGLIRTPSLDDHDFIFRALAPGS